MKKKEVNIGDEKKADAAGTNASSNLGSDANSNNNATLEPKESKTNR